MYNHRTSMLTENDSSEHLSAKINAIHKFIYKNHNSILKIHRTGVRYSLNTYYIKGINPSPPLVHMV